MATVSIIIVSIQRLIEQLENVSLIDLSLSKVAWIVVLKIPELLTSIIESPLVSAGIVGLLIITYQRQTSNGKLPNVIYGAPTATESGQPKTITIYQNDSDLLLETSAKLLGQTFNVNDYPDCIKTVNRNDITGRVKVFGRRCVWYAGKVWYLGSLTEEEEVWLSKQEYK